jgi:large subunit ribosomal protein L11
MAEQKKGGKKGKKEPVAQIKMQVEAGKASPSAKIGQALGPHGVNMMDFCKAFNDRTKSMEQGVLTPVILSIYPDRSFDFIVKQPPVGVLVKKALGLKKASQTPGKGEKIAKIKISQIKKIAEQKMPDLNCYSIEAAAKIVAGQCRSMGIEVVEG